MSRFVVTFYVLVVLVLGGVRPAGAQASSGWQLAPRAGVFVPTTSLGEVPISTQLVTAQATLRHGARLSAGMSVGLSVLREIGAEGTALRFDLDYVPPVRVDIQGYGGASPVEATMASVMAGVERSLSAAPGRLRPYMMAVAGFRTYTFQPGLSSGPQFPGGQASIAARLGGGVAMKVSVLSIGAELTDQVSTFSFGEGGRRMVNDLHGLLSVRVGIF